jgi:phage shock protein E
MMDRIVPTALAIAAVLVIAYSMIIKGGDISGGAARKLVQSGARLVDVRSPDEFAAGHIPGAINIPVQQLEARMHELEPKDGTVVLYCRSGRRSGDAARKLKGAGFVLVHDLGAMSRW